MKTITTLITVIFLSVLPSPAAIDGFSLYFSSNFSYTVPTGKILVLQQIALNPGIAAANAGINLNATGVAIPAATNGLYLLPKALILPAGTILRLFNQSFSATYFGVLIDTSDAPLFVGGGSSLGNVVVANNTMTGELQLSSTATSRVIIQSSTNLVDWSYDSSVVVQRSTDKTKVRFTVPVANDGHYYRALVRRSNAA